MTRNMSMIRDMSSISARNFQVYNFMTSLGTSFLAVVSVTLLHSCRMHHIMFCIDSGKCWIISLQTGTENASKSSTLVSTVRRKLQRIQSTDWDLPWNTISFSIVTMCFIQFSVNRSGSSRTCSTGINLDSCDCGIESRTKGVRLTCDVDSVADSIGELGT